MSCIYDFAICGARPLFSEPKPLGCLYRPDIEKVIEYSKIFYRNKRYTNDGELSKILGNRLADMHNVEHVVVFANGFSALLLIISALALPGRKEVILPSLAYRRLDDIVSWAGYVPRYCDIDRRTLSASIDIIRDSITDNTALILIQHSSVALADIEDISLFAKELGIPVVNDSALYFGKINGKMAGGFGNGELFLLNATKFINGFEGGYITTNDEVLASKLNATKRFGFNIEDEVSIGASLNAKLNETHAAMALAFLDDIDEYIKSFKSQYLAYKQSLGNADCIRFYLHNEEKSRYFRDMGIMIELLDSWPLTREETLRILNAENILARAYYYPLHYKDVGYERIVTNLPVTESVYSKLITLPQGAHVSIDDIYKIGDLFNRILKYSHELKFRLRRKK